MSRFKSKKGLPRDTTLSIRFNAKLKAKLQAKVKKISRLQKEGEFTMTDLIERAVIREVGNV